jgi:hypothetical protein
MPRKKASAGGCRLLKIGSSGNGIHTISLECRIKIYRPCKPANPAFTMSMIRRTHDRVCTREHVLKLIVSVDVCRCVVRPSVPLTSRAKLGGARRDRTDDLMLAKHALSQLSYGPYWFCEAGLPGEARGYQPGLRPSGLRRAGLLAGASEAWWARDELNVRPHAYQACALTT